jgi:hypothetical protein
VFGLQHEATFACGPPGISAGRSTRPDNASTDCSEPSSRKGRRSIWRSVSFGFEVAKLATRDSARRSPAANPRVRYVTGLGAPTLRQDDCRGRAQDASFQKKPREAGHLSRAHSKSA